LPVWATTINLNSDASLNFLSPSKEKAMGKKYYKEILATEVLYEDPIVTDYIEKLGRRLAKSAPKQRMHFFVLTNNRINAGTGPDGYIGIYTGLITIVRSEGELASVLAHEIAHVKQKHIARALERSNAMKIPSAVLTAAAIAVATKAPTVGTGALAASMTGLQASALNFSRENEFEADHIGLQILSNAGFNPHAMSAMFENLKQIARLYPTDVPEYLQTHPSDNSRLADSESLSMQYNNKNYLVNPMFDLIKARVTVATAEDPIATAQEFREKMSQNPNNPAYRYGYVLSLLRLNQMTEAFNEMKILLNQDPNNLTFLITYATLQEHVNQSNLATLKKAYDLAPHYYPAILAYTISLVDNRAPNAEQFALQQTKAYPDNPKFYYYLAKAQAYAGHNTQSQSSLKTYRKLLIIE
jgi:predicted Zn-dependent protease